MQRQSPQAGWRAATTSPHHRFALPTPVRTRIVRLIEVLLHNDTLVSEWCARHLHQAVLTVLHIGEDHYGLDQLCYDLCKIKAHELLTGDGKLYAHPLTEKGTKVTFLFCSSTINPPYRVHTANSSSRSLHPQHHPTTRSGLKMLKYRHLRMMP